MLLLLRPQLEKSESANADRDAQGQGDGFGPHARKKQDENEVVQQEVTDTTSSISPPSDETPPELDLVC